MMRKSVLVVIVRGADLDVVVAIGFSGDQVEPSDRAQDVALRDAEGVVELGDAGGLELGTAAHVNIPTWKKGLGAPVPQVKGHRSRPRISIVPAAVSSATSQVTGAGTPVQLVP